MLYICIPTHDEAPTVGVLLWRIRKVFQDYAREYEVLVYDDASSDGTREILEPYEKALPLSVLGGKTRVGYAKAVEALMREAANRTRYPRRDAAILMQADFTDRPEEIPELVKRFEGGADIVVGEPQLPADAPEQIRKLHKYAGWLPKLWPLKRGVTVPGVKHPYGSMRLLRIATVRDLLRGLDAAPLRRAESTWQTNLDLLAAAVPHARRVETVETALRYDLRMRDTRRNAKPEAWSLAKAAWAARGRKLSGSVTAVATSGTAAPPSVAPTTSQATAPATPAARAEPARAPARPPMRAPAAAPTPARSAPATQAATQAATLAAETTPDGAVEGARDAAPDGARERSRRKRSRNKRGRGDRPRDDRPQPGGGLGAEPALNDAPPPASFEASDAASDVADGGDGGEGGADAAANPQDAANARARRSRRSRRGGRRRREG